MHVFREYTSISQGNKSTVDIKLSSVTNYISQFAIGNTMGYFEMVKCFLPFIKSFQIMQYTSLQKLFSQ